MGQQFRHTNLIRPASLTASLVLQLGGQAPASQTLVVLMFSHIAIAAASLLLTAFTRAAVPSVMWGCTFLHSRHSRTKNTEVT